MSLVDDENARDSAHLYFDLSAKRHARRAEILAGDLPELHELLRGLPFARDDLGTDLRAWVKREVANATTGKLTVRVSRAPRTFSDAPCIENGKRALRAVSVEHAEWSVPHRARHGRYAKRLTVYLAGMRDREAQERTAGLAFREWCDITVRPSPDATAAFEVVLRNLLLMSAQSGSGFALRHVISHVRLDVAGPPPIPRPQGDQLVLEEDRTGPVETDPLLDDDRVGIVRRPAGVAPSMVVVSSVGHLPGGAKDGDRLARGASTPRAEFAPIAGLSLPLVHEADVAVVAARIRAEWPWAADVTRVLLADLVGQGWFRFRTTLLVGPPGAGKTRLARRIVELLGMHGTIYPCAGVMDASFGGTSRQWSTGRSSVPLGAIKVAMQANPVIVLDEIEKSGARSENGRLVDVLIPLLEAESAARYFDPYLETAVNLSAVSYIATANSLDGIPAPLKDRFRILRVPQPGPQHLGDLAQRIVDEIRRERGLDDTWMPDLTGDELDLLRHAWRGGSIRRLRRFVKTVVSGRDALAPRH